MYLIGRDSQAGEKRLILIGVAPQIARRYGKTVLLVKKSRGERHAASQIKHPRAPKYRMALQDLLCQLERVGSHDLAANEFDGIPLSVRILHIDRLFQNGEHSFTTWQRHNSKRSFTSQERSWQQRDVHESWRRTDIGSKR